ncbi:MAG TPA: hypothetical protein VK324_04670 [Tepidisphaeraceae bacterium]|nr:hypothetical protein [Tepidisphaeraceae bacterium]
MTSRSNNPIDWPLTILVVAAVLALVGVARAGQAPATEPAPAAAALSAEMVGEWFEGTVGPTTYWDSQTGKYTGSGRQMGTTLKLNADGTYEKYIYIYLKTYSVVSEVWTTAKGTATVAGDKITLTPTTGHYKSGGSGTKVDRPMTADDHARNTTTYTWRMETDEQGQARLVFPFDDGSAFRYRRTDAEKKE